MGTPKCTTFGACKIDPRGFAAKWADFGPFWGPIRAENAPQRRQSASRGADFLRGAFSGRCGAVLKKITSCGPPRAPKSPFRPRGGSTHRIRRHTKYTSVPEWNGCGKLGVAGSCGLNTFHSAHVPGPNGGQIKRNQLKRFGLAHFLPAFSVRGRPKFRRIR